MRLVVVTGVSGAGKSTALRALEDLGFYAVDNLPLPLVPELIELLASRPDVDRAALGDRRAQRQLPGRASRRCFADLRARGHTVEVLFLEASRRDPDPAVLGDAPPPPAVGHRHPRRHRGRAADAGGPAPGGERASSTPGTLNVHVLRGLIQERYGRGEGELAVTLLSFGFKHGIPSEADIVLDVRFLPNPFFVPELSALSGEDEAVVRFVHRRPRDRRRSCDGRGASGAPFRAGLPARGQVVRDRRHRLHGRASPLGRDRQGAGPPAGRRILAFPSATATSSDLSRARLDALRLAVGGKVRGSMATVAARAQVGLVIVTHGAAANACSRPPPTSSGRSPASTAVSRACRREAFDDIVRRVGRACDEVDSGAGILILADVHGSSPFVPAWRWSTARGRSRSSAA